MSWLFLLFVGDAETSRTMRYGPSLLYKQVANENWHSVGSHRTSPNLFTTLSCSLHEYLCVSSPWIGSAPSGVFRGTSRKHYIHSDNKLESKFHTSHKRYPACMNTECKTSTKVGKSKIYGTFTHEIFILIVFNKYT